MENRFVNILNMKRKKNGAIVLLVVVLAIGLISGLVACTVNGNSTMGGNPESPVVSNSETEVSSLNTQIYNGKTAIAIENTKIYDAYVITVNDQQEKMLVELTDQYFLNKNDIVQVIKESENYYRIILPYGDIPHIEGKVDKNAISYDSNLFETANQAYLKDATVYDGINGNAIEQKSGVGSIEKRKDGWALMSFPGGADSVWVKESDLSYNFDSLVETVID